MKVRRSNDDILPRRQEFSRRGHEWLTKELALSPSIAISSSALSLRLGKEMSWRVFHPGCWVFSSSLGILWSRASLENRTFYSSNMYVSQSLRFRKDFFFFQANGFSLLNFFIKKLIIHWSCFILQEYFQTRYSRRSIIRNWMACARISNYREFRMIRISKHKMIENCKHFELSNVYSCFIWILDKQAYIKNNRHIAVLLCIL